MMHGQTKIKFASRWFYKNTSIPRCTFLWMSKSTLFFYIRMYFVCCCCCSLFGSVPYSLHLPSFYFHIWKCCRNLLSKLHAHYKIFFSFPPELICVHGLYLCRDWASVSFNGECSLYTPWWNQFKWNWEIFNLEWNAVIFFFSVFLFPSNCLSLSVLLFLYLYFRSLSTSLPWFICFTLVSLNCSFLLLH